MFRKSILWVTQLAACFLRLSLASHIKFLAEAATPPSNKCLLSCPTASELDQTFITSLLHCCNCFLKPTPSCRLSPLHATQHTAATETVWKLTYDSLIYFPALSMQEIHRLQWKPGMANPNSPPWTQGLSSPGSNLSFLLRSYCFPTQSECSEGTLLYRPWICSWFPNSQTFLMLFSPPGMFSTYPSLPDKINTPKPNSTPLPL